MSLLLTLHVVVTTMLLLVFALLVSVQWALRRPAAAVGVVPSPVPREVAPVVEAA
jgi:hypothetical protein